MTVANVTVSIHVHYILFYYLATEIKEIATPAPKWKRLTPNPANKVGGIGTKSKNTIKSSIADLKTNVNILKTDVLVATSGNSWKLRYRYI